MLLSLRGGVGQPLCPNLWHHPMRLCTSQAQGRLQRRLAHRVRIPAPAAAAGDEQPSTSSYHRGHKLSATALALTSDDRTAYTVSKDGGIVRWDIETMKRTQLYRYDCGCGCEYKCECGAAIRGPGIVRVNTLRGTGV